MRRCCARLIVRHIEHGMVLLFRLVLMAIRSPYRLWLFLRSGSDLSSSWHPSVISLISPL
ncbi:TPA: hypothetical protein SIA31_003472 [Aeromonas sobria]|nr:hypothetical protein [Aeromonas sobria]